MDTPDHAARRVSERELLTYLRLCGDLFPLAAELIERKTAVRAARAHGLTVGDDELQEAVDRFRRLAGLEDPADTRKWLRANGLTLEDLEAHLETNLLIAEWKEYLLAEAEVGKVLGRGTLRDQIRQRLFERWYFEARSDLDPAPSPPAEEEDGTR